MRPRAKQLVARLGVAAFLAAAPKCLGCALAYAGLFGLGGAELCGGKQSPWPTWLPMALGAATVAAFILLNRFRRALSLLS